MAYPLPVFGGFLHIVVTVDITPDVERRPMGTLHYSVKKPPFVALPVTAQV